MLIVFRSQTDVWWQYLYKHGRKKKIDFSTQQTYGEEDICHKHAAYLEIVVSISSLVFLPASSKTLITVQSCSYLYGNLNKNTVQRHKSRCITNTQSDKFRMHCNTENKKQVVKISRNFTVKIVILVIKKEDDINLAQIK